MRIAFTILSFLILFLKMIPAMASDSFFSNKHQFTFGTTGIYLPEFQEYNISGNHQYIFSSHRMKLSHLNYSYSMNKSLAIAIGYDGLRSRKFVIVTDPNDYEHGNYSRMVNLNILLIGLNYSFKSFNVGNNSLVTSFGTMIQYRFGEELIGKHRPELVPLDGPGVKLSLSENLLFKKRYILGINADFHAFYQPDREFQMKDHNYFMSNALYLGVKF